MGKFPKYFVFVVVSIMMVASAFAQDAEAIFEQGNAHYAADEFQEAVDSYKQVLDMDMESATLYFNLGNAYYKLNRVAPSIYYYEKARQLAPNDRDIKNNLEYAENLRVDAIASLPENTVRKWINTMVDIATYNGWAVVSVVGLLAFVTFFLLYYFAFDTGRKRLYFTMAFLAVIVTLAGVGFANYAFAKAESDRPAIVFAQEVDVKSEPKMGSELAFTLHAGTKVLVMEDEGDWKRIQLADGKVGWIPETEIKEL